MTQYSDRPIETDAATPVIMAAGYAGLIPFVVAAGASWLGIALPFGADGVMLAQTYGAVILSFLGGIRWGVALSPLSGAVRGKHIALSVLPPLAAWVAVLMPAPIALTLLLAGFAAQLYWDLRAYRSGLIPQWFRDLRVVLTMGAILCLVAILPQIA